MSTSLHKFITPHGDVTLKRYARSKHLKLYLDAAGNYVVSAPKYIGLSQVETFLSQHMDTLEQWAQTIFRPYHHAMLNDTKLCIEDCDCSDGLRVQKNGKTVDNVKKALKARAKRQLPQRLDLWARTMSVPYGSLRLGFPKSRWGSCSSSGTLSLSCMLVTLPLELQDYVIVHELSHVRNMNHGPEFWNQVALYDANYVEHRKALKHLRSHI